MWGRRVEPACPAMGPASGRPRPASGDQAGSDTRVHREARWTMLGGVSRRLPNEVEPAFLDRLQLHTPEGTWVRVIDGVCFVDEAGTLMRVPPPPAVACIALRPEVEGVVAQGLGDGDGLRVNAVQVTGTVRLKPGDELQLGRLSASLVRQTRLPKARLRPEPLLEPWVEAAVARVRGGGGALSIWVFEAEVGAPWSTPSGPGLTAFRLGERTRVVVNESELEPSRPLESRVARFPRDGGHSSALLASALGVTDAEESPLALEPATLRLSGLMAALRDAPGPLLFEGEAGVGRAFRAEHWLRSRGAKRVLRVSGLQPGGLGEALRLQEGEALQLQEGEALLVEEVERLAAREQRSLAAWRGPWAATSREGAQLEVSLAGRFERARIYVPPLRDRPAELQAMLDAELVRLRQERGRPGLQLERKARELLLSDVWPENLDGLRASLTRAAYLAQGDWLRAQELPVWLRSRIVTLGLSEAREEVERSILLGALEETSWNVAETARRLRMPRRSLVHRMKVVGLKRPVKTRA